jgi:F-type H+-transporting ATPase subunit alpha
LNKEIHEQFERSLGRIDDLIRSHRAAATAREIGVVSRISRGVAEIHGLPKAQSDELLLFPKDKLGFVFNLDRERIGCVLLDSDQQVRVGDEVRRTQRVVDVPVGPELLGRVIDPVGRPLDGKGPLQTLHRFAVERDAPSIMDRAPVIKPLQTGIKVIDALVPVGRGQRQLILGDRQTGKTSVALDAVINQQDENVICVYCSVGQRSTSVATVINDLKRNEAMNHCVVVVGQPDSPPGLQFITPYAATSIGEYFMEKGHDVLIVYDELTAHARSYREMSLLLRRPPGREAFPGDIFYIHARLLERATHLCDEAGGGSLTALPIVETEAQNVAAYIPTNLISITDGQVYLSPDRFQKGILPAVDVGRSVSRVGGKAQLPAYRKLTGPLRLAFTQFEELEKFARFSSQLDQATKQSLHRGQRVREVLRQELHDTQSVGAQIISLVATTQGVFDSVELDRIQLVEKQVQQIVIKQLPTIIEKIERGEQLSADEIKMIEETALTVVKTMETSPHQVWDGADNALPELGD